MLHRIYHLTIKCGDSVKGMSVSCIDPCTYEEMMVSAISKFGADRVIELIAKQTNKIIDRVYGCVIFSSQDK